MDYHTLPRRQLQALCKKHGIPANAANSDMANALTALLQPKPDTDSSKTQPQKRTTRSSEPASSETVTKSQVLCKDPAEELHTEPPKSVRSCKIEREGANRMPSRVTRGHGTVCAVQEEQASRAPTAEKTATKCEMNKPCGNKLQEGKKVSIRNRKQCNPENLENAQEKVDSRSLRPKSEKKKENSVGIGLRRGRVKVRSPRNFSKSPESSAEVSEKVADTKEEKARSQSCIMDSKTRKNKRSVTFAEVSEVKTAHVEYAAKTAEEPDKEAITEILQAQDPNLPKEQISSDKTQKLLGTRNASRAISLKVCIQDVKADQDDVPKRSKKPTGRKSKAEVLRAPDAKKGTRKETGKLSDIRKSTRATMISSSGTESAENKNEAEVADENVLPTRRSRRLTIAPTDMIRNQELPVANKCKDHPEGSWIAPKKTESSVPAEISRRSRRKTLAPLELNQVQYNVEGAPEMVDKTISRVKGTPQDGHVAETHTEPLKSQQKQSKLKTCDSISVAIEAEEHCLSEKEASDGRNMQHSSPEPCHLITPTEGSNEMEYQNINTGDINTISPVKTDLQFLQEVSNDGSIDVVMPRSSLEVTLGSVHPDKIIAVKDTLNSKAENPVNCTPTNLDISKSQYTTSVGVSTEMGSKEICMEEDDIHDFNRKVDSTELDNALSQDMRCVAKTEAQILHETSYNTNIEAEEHCISEKEASDGMILQHRMPEPSVGFPCRHITPTEVSNEMGYQNISTVDIKTVSSVNTDPQFLQEVSNDGIMKVVMPRSSLGMIFGSVHPDKGIAVKDTQESKAENPVNSTPTNLDSQYTTSVEASIEMGSKEFCTEENDIHDFNREEHSTELDNALSQDMTSHNTNTVDMIVMPISASKMAEGAVLPDHSTTPLVETANPDMVKVQELVLAAEAVSETIHGFEDLEVMAPPNQFLILKNTSEPKVQNLFVTSSPHTNDNTSISQHVPATEELSDEMLHQDICKVENDCGEFKQVVNVDEPHLEVETAKTNVIPARNIRITEGLLDRDNGQEISQEESQPNILKQEELLLVDEEDVGKCMQVSEDADVVAYACTEQSQECRVMENTNEAKIKDPAIYFQSSDDINVEGAYSTACSKEFGSQSTSSYNLPCESVTSNFCPCADEPHDLNVMYQESMVKIPCAASSKIQQPGLDFEAETEIPTLEEVACKINPRRARSIYNSARKAKFPVARESQSLEESTSPAYGEGDAVNPLLPSDSSDEADYEFSEDEESSAETEEALSDTEACNFDTEVLISKREADQFCSDDDSASNTEEDDDTILDSEDDTTEMDEEALSEEEWYTNEELVDSSEDVSSESESEAEDDFETFDASPIAHSVAISEGLVSLHATHCLDDQPGETTAGTELSLPENGVPHPEITSLENVIRDMVRSNDKRQSAHDWNEQQEVSKESSFSDDGVTQVLPPINCLEDINNGVAPYQNPTDMHVEQGFDDQQVEITAETDSSCSDAQTQLGNDQNGSTRQHLEATDINYKMGGEHEETDKVPSMNTGFSSDEDGLIKYEEASAFESQEISEGLDALDTINGMDAAGAEWSAPNEEIIQVDTGSADTSIKLSHRAAGMEVSTELKNILPESGQDERTELSYSWNLPHDVVIEEAQHAVDGAKLEMEMLESVDSGLETSTELLFPCKLFSEDPMGEVEQRSLNWIQIEPELAQVAKKDEMLVQETMASRHDDLGHTQVINFEAVDQIQPTIEHSALTSFHEQPLLQSQACPGAKEGCEITEESSLISEVSREQSLQQIDLTLLSKPKLRQMCKENQTSAETLEMKTPANKKAPDYLKTATKQAHLTNTPMHPKDLPSANKRSVLQDLSSNVKATPSMQTPRARVMHRPQNLMMASCDGSEGTGAHLVTPSPRAPISAKRDFARSHHR